MFSSVPTAISCRSVDPSSSRCRAAESSGVKERWLVPGTLALRSAGGSVEGGTGSRGCFSKERWKGSITWSTSRTPSVFVWIRVPQLVHHIGQECAIKQRVQRGKMLWTETLVAHYEFTNAARVCVSCTLNF